MRYTVRLGREAAAKARKPDDVRKAALAAAAKAGGDVLFARFEANGQQFALSTRMVIDVDWLPNRVPDKVIRRAVKKR